MRKLLLICTVFIVILTGCKGDEEETQPEFTTPYEYAEKYIDLWLQQEFETIYNEFLLQNTKAKFSYEDYGERYKHLYEVLNVRDLSIEITERNEIPEQELETLKTYEIPISISFQTIAGPIKYTKNIYLEKLIEEEYVGESNIKIDPSSPWLIKWDPSFIIPNLEPGDEVRLSKIVAKRGEILDRNGTPLAENGRVFEVGVVLEHFNENQSLTQLSSVLNLPEDYIKNKYEQSWVQPNYFVPIKRYSLKNEDIISEATSIQGVTSRVVDERIYPYGEITAHLTGYIGQINAEELEQFEDQGYSAQDRIGKRGLEQLFERQLRGEDGYELIVDKTDGSVITITKIEPVDGQTLNTSIDIELQNKLYQILKSEKGTAMTLNPNTGEITSLLSFPAFDPNKFILGITQTEYEELIQNPNNPLLNRFTLTYSPGSTMKVLTSIIGFNQGVLDPNEKVTIQGDEWQKDSSWGNYYVSRLYANDTQVDLRSAFINSDNIYFAQLGTQIGAQAFEKGLKNLGLGQTIPFDYPVSSSQISNDGTLNRPILLADTSYGQGEVLMNIVHLTSIYGGIINGGNIMKPKLIGDSDDEVWIDQIVSNEEASLLENMLRLVVSQGTANAINLPNRQIAGKTGTAELKSSEDDHNAEENGVFISYDQQNPNQLLTIIIEDVKERGGSHYAVELAKKYYQSN